MGVAGVDVTLTGCRRLGNPVDVTVQTDVDGNYLFPDLRPSDATGYTITETQPAGLLDGIDTAGSLGGDATTTNDVISGIVVNPGDSGTDYDFAELPPASLSGSVYDDLNNDGVFDAGEPGIAGVDVTLTGTDDLGNPVDVTMQTDADGNYLFSDLRPSGATGYTITETQPVGFLDGQDAIGTQGGVAGNDVLSSIVIGPGTDGTGNTFGELKASAISGAVYEDTNNNGIQDAGEPGIAGVDVTLTGIDDLGNPVDVTVQTDADGLYLFDGLRPSDASGYTVASAQPAGYLDGIDTPGTLGGIAGDDAISAIVLGPGETAGDNTFGELLPSSLGGAVYEDTDNDGVFDATETGIEGVDVTLVGTDDLGDAVDITVQTDADGNYSFDDLRPGDYSILETQPVGFFDGIDTIGSQGGTVAPDEFIIVLVSDTTGTGNNFGELAGAAIGDYVWLDVDDDGVQDPASGLDGITVNLYAADGVTLVDTTTTAGGGLYAFTDITPFQDYVVEVVARRELRSPRSPDGGEADDSDVDAAGRVTVTPVSGAQLRRRRRRDRAGRLVGDGLVRRKRRRRSRHCRGAARRRHGQPLRRSRQPRRHDDDGSDGSYTFAGLLPGIYDVEVVYPDATYAGLGNDSDVDPVTGIATVTLDSGETSDGGDAGVQPAVIGDFVWLDLNNDGVQDAGEPGVGGVAVTLLDDEGTVVDTATTDDGGAYSFTALPGDYEVVVTPPTNGAFTATGAGAPDTDSDVDAAGSTGVVHCRVGRQHRSGRRRVSLPADISGVVWLDLDQNGLNDDNAPIEGVVVNLYDAAGAVVATTTTGADGTYSFDGLIPGDYTVEVIPPGGAAFTAPGGDSDVDPADGTATLAAGGSETVDAGILPGFVSGNVWLDLDGDGTNNGEAGAGGVPVTLLDAAGNEVATTVTDGNGDYTFGPLLPGDYTVVVDAAALPDGTVQTFDLDGVLDDMTDVTLTIGTNVGDVDFGYRPPATVEGVVFSDLDGDGTQDPGEPGIGGVVVILTDVDGNVVVVTTAPDGSYSAAVAPGTVTIDVDDATVPPGDVLTTANDPQTVEAGSGETVLADPIGYQPASAGLRRCVGRRRWRRHPWYRRDRPRWRHRDPGRCERRRGRHRGHRRGRHLRLQRRGGRRLRRRRRRGDAAGRRGCRHVRPGGALGRGHSDDGLHVGGDVTDVDFGYMAVATGALSGTVWEDTDNDGRRTPARAGSPAWRLRSPWLGPERRVPGGGDDVVLRDGDGRRRRL